MNSERQRFDESVAETIDELEQLRDRTTAEIGAEQAAIFRVQLTILRDPHFAHTVAELSEEYAAVHPTILRAIRHATKAADKASRPLTVCGEMAGHPTIAPLLVGLGIRRLSMSPSRCLNVRNALRHLDGKEAAAIARQALQCHSRQQVRQLLAPWRTCDGPDGFRLNDDANMPS